MKAIDMPNYEKAGSREWLGLATLALPTLLVSMDMTVIYLAIPSISAALKPSSSQMLWITDAFGFFEAGMLITMGTLGDRVGRRRLLLYGAVAFAIASAIAAFSNSAGMLIAARALLGIAGSTLLPSTLSLIRNMFHNERQRTFAIGIWTTCFSTGTLLGPFVGGFLLAHFWWGSVFLMGVPIMILLLLLAPALLPEFKSPIKESFDIFSAFLSFIAVLVTIYGIKQIAQNGLNWPPLIAVAAGFVTGLVFIRRQKTTDHPLIDLSLFKPEFTVTLIAFMIALFGWAGTYLFITQHLQLVLGMTPFTAGLWTIPAAAGSVAGCMLAPVALRRFRNGFVMAAGMGVMTIGMLMLWQTGTATGLAFFICATILISTGCGTAVTTCQSIVLTSAPPDKAGTAAGLAETSATYGGALGVALLGSLGTVVYHTQMTGTVLKNVSGEAAETIQSTLGGAVSALAKLPRRQSDDLLIVARMAFEQSFRLVAVITAGITIIIAAVVGLRLKRMGERQDLMTQPAPDRV